MTTVIFDLDGTLADTSGDLIEAANACFRALGVGERLDPARDQLTAFQGARAMLRLGFMRGDRDWSEADVDRLYPELLVYYGENINCFTKVYEGVEAALETLEGKGVHLGVCTNKPVGLAETLLTRLGLRGHFGAVLGSDSLPVKKPDPEHLFETIRQVGGDISRAVLVGDTMNDRETARAANVPSILVTFGPLGRGVDEMEPEGMLDNYGDLSEVLKMVLHESGVK